MNINTKNLNYSLILSTLFLLGLAGIVSFGYMGYRASITNNSTLNAEILNPQNLMTITGDTEFSLDITLDELSILEANNELTNYIEDTKNVTIKLNIDTEKYTGAITCDYIFSYEPNVLYNASNQSVEAGLTELGFSGNSNDLSFDPVSIAGSGPKIELYKGQITSDASTGTAEQTWQLFYRFYNLNVDQSGAVNQKPSGKFIVEGQNCYAAKNN